MLVGTVLGVFVIPVLFVIFQGLQEHYGKPVATKENDVALLDEENEK
jgi:HAE1 family hydrophobic/amphiphilic exporter-1